MRSRPTRRPEALGRSRRGGDGGGGLTYFFRGVEGLTIQSLSGVGLSVSCSRSLVLSFYFFLSIMSLFLPLSLFIVCNVLRILFSSAMTPM